MSAFIISEKQIELLATVAAKQYYGDNLVGEITRIAQLLWKENHKSVNYRYSEKNRTPKVIPKDYDYYQNLLAQFTPIEIYKLAQCYEYQSCEHDTYAKSKAHAIVADILLRCASDIIGNLSAYDDAEWAL
jgi:hypothetical protein